MQLTYWSKMTLLNENIIEMFKKDENTAFKFLYAKYKKSFVSQLLSNNSAITKEDAIDLFQDSLIILYDKIVHKKIATLDRPDIYLDRIGQLLTYEFLRKKKVIGKVENINIAVVNELGNYDFLSSQENKKIFLIGF